MIRFFKSAFPQQYIVIGFIGLLLWLRCFIDPRPMPPPDGPVPLYDGLYFLLSGYPVLAALLGFMLTLTLAFWFSLILNRHELVQKNSSLSALVFVILLSFYPDQMTLNPVLIALLFLLLILHHLLISYKKPEHLDRFFAAGFFTAAGSLFYLPFLFWFGITIVSFILFRSGRWREWMSLLIGLATPYLYLAVYYFWLDALPAKIIGYKVFFPDLLVYPNPFKPDYLLTGGFLLLLALWGTYKLWSGPIEKTVEIRAKINLFLWVILLSILSFSFARSLAVFHPALAAPAFTLAITASLTGLKKTRFAEIVLLTYFGIILLNNLLVHFIIYP
jgi:hypothetical protein